ncbi:MAG: phosphoenolpyruvate--protein phosphotransferase, partial [bacterium]
MPAVRKPSSGEMILRGIGVSPGIAVAPVFLLIADDRLVPERRLTEGEAPAELMRLENAVIETRRQLTEIQRHVEEQAGSQHAGIFDMHKLVLDDPAFISEVFDGILKRHANVEHAVRLASESYNEILSRVEDDYLRERVSDVKDVARRLMRNLSDSARTPLTGMSVRSVIVGVDLAPSETATLQRELVLGFATDQGSPTSHTAIMARALGIPAVVGLRDISQLVKAGEEILVDGSSGEVVLRPSFERRRKAVAHTEARRTIEIELGTLRDQPAETSDGHAIVLSANVELVSELPMVLQSGAQGIGLFRSEYLYISRETLPSEDEQLAAYGEATKAMASRPVIIRTVDLGGDKFASSVRVPNEINPFLGFRAIRFCLAQPALFKTQIRAILRASALGRVSMMYPMISNVGEVRQANQIVEACKEELRNEGKAFDPEMPVGAMVEIPSAALTAEII